MSAPAQFLSESAEPPLDGSKAFSLERWEEWRDRVVPPQIRTELGESVQGRLEFLEGAALMGLRFDPDADPLESGVLKPVQLLISDLLDVPHDSYVFEIVRRASKTTSILCKMLGRCKMRPGYQVSFMAQSGVAGSRRLRDWKITLDLVNPEDTTLPPWLRGKARPKPKALVRQTALFGDELMPLEQRAEPEFYGRGFRILAGEVGKGIYFDNGSRLLVYKPDASAVRGDAADVTWIDEAQDVDPEDAADLLAGLLPLLDTRPSSALVFSGTAGPARIGPWWDELEKLRARDPDVGGCDYTAGQYEVDAEPIDWALIEDEDAAMRLLLTVHPGIDTLTTLEKMRKGYRSKRIPRPQWAQEYLSIWPRVAGAKAVPTEWWERAHSPELEAAIDGGAGVLRPPRIAFAVDITPGGRSSAIVAAWRDDDGVAWIELVDHRLGTDYLPKRMQHLTRTYLGSDVSFDNIAEGMSTFTEAQQLRPVPRMRVQPYRDHAAGCVRILRDLEAGTLRHGNQAGLNAAVRVAARRSVRGEERGVWLWAVGPEGGDITPLVAATRALRAWDQHYAGKGRKRRAVVAA